MNLTESNTEDPTMTESNTDDTSAKAMADGGTEQIRDSNDVRHSDNEVRRYSADGHLYAYREGDEHVVVSRGNEPETRWQKRIPTTVKQPIPGQKRWTIPENWEQRVYLKRDSTAYALYYVPESDVWARVSIPTNDRLTDAWYRVKAVGDLNVEPVGELGSSYDVRQLANEYEEKYNADGVEEDAEAFREIADNWDIVEEDLRLTTEWVRNEGLDEMQPDDQPIHADRDWQIEFHQDRIFRPDETLKQAVDFSEYEIPLSVIFNELREAELLPSHYSFELVLDDSSIETESNRSP